MKIFYVSNFANKHPYTKCIARWFRYFGHEVATFEMYGCDGERKYRDPLMPPLYHMNRDFVARCCAYKPDLVLVFKGDTIFKSALETIKKKVRPLMATWWVDDPFVRWTHYHTGAVFTNTVESLYLWDHFFVFETHAFMRLKRLGVQNPYYLPSATDATYFHPLKKRIASDARYYGSECSFIGTPDHLRAEMVHTLSSHKLKLWGPRWENPRFQKLHVRSHLSNTEVNKVYNYSTINLNRHLVANTTGANVRTFDIAASGGFMLTDNMYDITHGLYEKDTEVVVYDDMRDLRRKVAYYLKHEEERRGIATCAYEKTRKKHLYKHRIEELLTVLGQR